MAARSQPPLALGLALCAALVASGSILADEAPHRTPEQVREWLRDRIQRSLAWEPEPRTMYEYTVSFGDGPDPSELRALAAEVEGKPEHPKRAEYERLLKISSSGPETQIVRLFYVSRERWRVLTEFTSPSEGGAEPNFWDTGRDGQITWSLTPGQLRAGVAGSRDDCDYSDRLNEATNTLRSFVFQWDDDVLPESVGTPEREAADGGWSVEVRKASGSSSRYRLIDRGSGLKIESRDLDGTVGQSSPISDQSVVARVTWGAEKEDPILGAVASSFRYLFGQPTPGRLAQLRSFVRAWREPTIDPDAAVRLPKLGAPDPFRQTVRSKSIWDRTPSQILSSGTSQEVPTFAEPSSNHARSRNLRWLGWGSLGVLVTLFIIVRVRSARRSLFAHP